MAIEINRIQQTQRAREDGRTTKRRRRLPWGFLLAGVAIAGAVLYLVLANTSTTAEYYMTIHELRTCSSCGAPNGQAVRVTGVVAADSIQRDDATHTISFAITDKGESLPVTYSGVVPDTFNPGIQVVAEGHLTKGVFHAQDILAKCPSKFQSATPSPQTGAPANATK